MYSTEIFSNTVTIREVKSTERHRITGHYIAYLPTAKPSVTTSKNSIEFTYGDFPWHLKVKRVKSALIYWLQRCKQGERWTITANSFTKIDRFGGFRPLWRRSRWGNPAAPGTNQIAGFVEFRPLTISKKSIYLYALYVINYFLIEILACLLQTTLFYRTFSFINWVDNLNWPQ